VLALCCAAARPDLVLISVDTLRADRLGCYGHGAPTSPHIDALAATALRFDDFLCEVPLTAPSFGAMFTGRPPRAIGMTRNGLRLREGIPTAAEALHAAGYHTVAVQSNWTAKAHLSGLDRGFDVYDDDFHEARWGLLKSERGGAEVTRRALELLAARPADRPIFAWFHYSDPHAPYELHPEHLPSGAPRRFTRRARRVGQHYDSEVGYTDAMIGRLLPALPPGAVVVFLADHGESLYEHDYLGHGRKLYHNTLRVPLLIRAPGVAPGASAAPARGIDVAATLLGLAGLPPLAGDAGVDLLRAPPPPERVRVVEAYRGAVPNLPFGLRNWMAARGPIKQAVVQGPWKLIVTGKRQELYHLGQDPGELRNLHLRERERAAALRAALAAWDETTERAQEETQGLDVADMEALRSLGYLD
jgi:arylsulfatase A-like enzyme